MKEKLYGIYAMYDLQNIEELKTSESKIYKIQKN